MKKLLPLLLLALAFTPLHAADTKPARKTREEKRVDAFVKTNAGKRLKLAVVSVGDIGSVSSESPYAAIPVTTAGSGKTPDLEISAIVPTAQVESFLKTAAPRSEGGSSAFGKAQKPGSLEGVLIVVQGEPCVVIGPVTPEVSAKKPSALLAAQLDPAKNPEPSAKSETRPEKTKPEKKAR